MTHPVGISLVEGADGLPLKIPTSQLFYSVQILIFWDMRKTKQIIKTKQNTKLKLKLQN